MCALRCRSGGSGENLLLAVEHRALARYRGRGAGGLFGQRHSAEQEGLRLPPVKLFKKGVMDAGDVADHLLQHPRVEQRIGDVQGAGLGAPGGRGRLAELLDRYGDATVTEAIAEMRSLAARQMRAMIGLMPEGTYRATAIVDSDGVVNEPLTIALAVTNGGER